MFAHHGGVHPHGTGRPPAKKSSVLPIAIVVAVLGVGAMVPGSLLMVEGMDDSCSGRSASMPAALAKHSVAVEGAKVCWGKAGEATVQSGEVASVDLGYKSSPTFNGRAWQKHVALEYMTHLGKAGWSSFDCSRNLAPGILSPSWKGVESLCFEKGAERLSVDLQLNERSILIHTLAARIRLSRVGSKNAR
jgi:hypothetical protein